LDLVLVEGKVARSLAGAREIRNGMLPSGLRAR